MFAIGIESSQAMTLLMLQDHPPHNTRVISFNRSMSRQHMQGRIFQLNCSQGGVPKLPVQAAELTLTGLACDKQRHTRFHGGPARTLFILRRAHT
jgi:MOSC domain-containing protein YiiM